MEEQNELDKLLVSYLLKELTPEEEAKVIETINSTPEFLQYFDEFKKIFRLLDIKKNIDGINLEEERNHLEQIRLAGVPEIDAGVCNTEYAPESSRSVTYKLFRAVAVAASVIFILGIGWWMFSKRELKKPAIVENNKTIDDTKKISTRNEVNISGATRRCLLTDGTEVTLWDKSGLTFQEFFSTNRRDIELKGKAGFKVAKDTTRPFTVYSGDITTTALGTEFIVTNFEKDQNITIRLLEGHVMIKSSDKAKVKLKKSIHLWAGQELLYNKQTAAALVRKTGNHVPGPDLANSENAMIDNPFVSNSGKGSWFMFNNQSLAQVFDQLEQMFVVEIEYNRKDMQKIYFIGKFDKTDSLEYILKNITTINHLTLTKQGNKFIIQK